jgi:hypothetical protein
MASDHNRIASTVAHRAATSGPWLFPEGRNTLALFNSADLYAVQTGMVGKGFLRETTLLLQFLHPFCYCHEYSLHSR